MQTKLTVIVDNIPQEPLHGEWGLSILAAHRGSSILIDAGASGLFAENMRALGLSIRDVDCAMLSHAHYDHANGMVRFFQENATAKFYLRESAQENCYARYLIFRKYIGLSRHVLTDYKDRIVRRLSAFRWRVSDRAQDAGLIADRKARTDVSENTTWARAG